MRRRDVLVIDADEAYIRAIVDVLTPYGLKVSIARSTSEALTLIDRRPPVIFIIEPKTPEVDGLQLIQWIRQHPRWAKTPILVASASAMPEEKEAALAAGATAFIAKPFTARELREVIRRYVPLPLTTQLRGLRGEQ